MQFLHACNFYFLGFGMLTQFPRPHNFYVFIIHSRAQFLRVYNFYYFVMLVRIQFLQNTISTRARSAPAKNELQFLRCGNFYVYEMQFRHNFYVWAIFTFLAFRMCDNFSAMQFPPKQSTGHALKGRVNCSIYPVSTASKKYSHTSQGSSTRAWV